LGKIREYAISVGQLMVDEAQGRRPRRLLKNQMIHGKPHEKENVCDPKVLAKKTIMLLAEVCNDHKRANSQVSTSCDHGSSSSPGKILYNKDRRVQMLRCFGM
jgi:hypothetical protein